MRMTDESARYVMLNCMVQSNLKKVISGYLLLCTVSSTFVFGISSEEALCVAALLCATFSLLVTTEIRAYVA